MPVELLQCLPGTRPAKILHPTMRDEKVRFCLCGSRDVLNAARGADTIDDLGRIR